MKGTPQRPMGEQKHCRYKNAMGQMEIVDPSFMRAERKGTGMQCTVSGPDRFISLSSFEMRKEKKMEVYATGLYLERWKETL